MIPLALTLSLSVALLESLTYLGSFRSHTGLPAIFLYIFSLSTFLAPINPSKIIQKMLNLVLPLLTSFIIFIFVVLSLVESFRYPNYVFSTTHINLAGLEILLILTIIFYFLNQSLGQSLKQKTASALRSGLVIVAVLSFADLVPFIYKSTAPIFASPLSTYDQKMTRAYPGFYPAMMQVKSLTSDSSTILIPPQGAPWVLEGNAALVSRFLYPRRVESYDPSDADFSPNTYVLIAKGSWTEAGAMEKGWPKNPVLAKRIWRFDLARGASEEYSRDYNPVSDTWDWGLIEVSHE